MSTTIPSTVERFLIELGKAILDQRTSGEGAKSTDDRRRTFPVVEQITLMPPDYGVIRPNTGTDYGPSPSSRDVLS